MATAPEKISLKESMFKTTGLLGAAMLALTACGGDEAAPAEAADADQVEADTDEEAGTDTEPADEPTEEEVPDAPEIGEAEDAIWQSSLDQDSVTINAVIPINPLGDAAEHVDENINVETEIVRLVLSGDMAGDGYTYTLNETMGDYRIFSDQAVQSVDSVIEEYAANQVDIQGVTPEDFREALEPEGEWVDMTSLANQLETPALFIENLRSSILTSAGVEDLSAWEADAATDTHEGEDVWVYSSENDGATVEFIVLADEQEPLLMEIRSESAGEETVVTFSDWNEVAEPERPEDDVVIGEDEFQGIADSLV
ncbi:hypothetical protein I2485_08235 [Nesterenkonia sp. E16_7]|uniref:hypothetical protein n=1 Tax=unclassified Nesterenkonia TaxID=2629769 RepID=UPI001A915918|nr:MULTISPECIES: hypothetical protein [unclassified Nesterenkonia]MBO0594986.1 hypothetical protein [Nesterenkonia sp. E16_10]MBO0598641.1 hypothetical protein [Nesterenkonia sp. E16_7]